MKEQDKRAVESLCLCGMDFDTVCHSFAEFSRDEIKIIFDEVNKQSSGDEDDRPNISMNCS